MIVEATTTNLTQKIIHQKAQIEYKYILYLETKKKAYMKLIMLYTLQIVENF